MQYTIYINKHIIHSFYTYWNLSRWEVCC